MYNVLSVQQIKSAEAELIRSGISGSLLAANAALAIADGIAERSGEVGAKTAVFCGGGGNGCDGVLAAIRLHRMGRDVAVYTVGRLDDNSAAGEALRFARCNGVKIHSADEYDGSADIIIDAIFGIGLNRAVTGATADLIDRLNSQENAFRFAVDVPSGLNADSGEIMGTAFHAHVTMTFSCYKQGMLFGCGRDCCGRILVEDIGICTSSDVKVYTDADFKPYKRKQSAHKGNAGRVYVIGGCGTMIGAPLMAGAAAHAAHLSGAGTVTVCVPSVHRTATSARSTMSMMKYLKDTPDGFIEFDNAEFAEIADRADAINIGMGMGKTPDLKRILQYFCENYDKSLIIDADAINCLNGDTELLKNARCNIVLTPHVGEFKRLTCKDPTIENARKLADDIGGTVVLKSATTIVTDGKETRLNVTGTPAMAKGGMGDILGGCIAALSCAFSTLDAATIACYRNGVGAERAVSSYAEMMLTANDVLHMANYPELDD